MSGMRKSHAASEGEVANSPKREEMKRNER